MRIVSHSKRSILLFVAAPALFTIAWLRPINVSAATITIGTNTPAVGVGVQNLVGATAAGNNVGVQFINNNYIANSNNSSLGQTFTTGSNSWGYQLTAISYRQATYSSTWWNGSTNGVRIFKPDGATNGV